MDYRDQLHLNPVLPAAAFLLITDERCPLHLCFYDCGYTVKLAYMAVSTCWRILKTPPSVLFPRVRCVCVCRSAPQPLKLMKSITLEQKQKLHYSTIISPEISIFSVLSSSTSPKCFFFLGGALQFKAPSQAQGGNVCKFSCILSLVLKSLVDCHAAVTY